MTHEELLQWRHDHNLTQSALANLLPVPTSTLRHWEHGRQKFPPFLPRALESVARELAEKNA